MSKAIVVGVDGSDASREALRWARRRGTPSLRAARRRPRVVVRPGAADRRSGDARDARRRSRRPARRRERGAHDAALESAVSEALGAEPGMRGRAEARRGRRRRRARRRERVGGARRRRLARTLRAQGRAPRLGQQARRQPRRAARSWSSRPTPARRALGLLGELAVAVGDAARGVRPPAERHAVVVDRDVGVVVLGLGQLTHAVHERERIDEASRTRTCARARRRPLSSRRAPRRPVSTIGSR